MKYKIYGTQIPLEKGHQCSFEYTLLFRRGAWGVLHPGFFIQSPGQAETFKRPGDMYELPDFNTVSWFLNMGPVSN